VSNYPRLVYLNGEYTPPEEARVSVFDRGFVFADGVYEVIPVYGRRLFRLEQHLDRLDNSLHSIVLANPLARADWQQICTRLIDANEADDQSIYLQVTRGPAPRDHAFPADTRPTVFAYSAPLKYPDTTQLTNGVTAITIPDVRWRRCDIKSIALLPNVLARQQASAAGAAEAILIRDGIMTEGSASNIFAVANGTLVTPPKGPYILPGVTRDLVLELARANGMPCAERELPEAEMRAADELMLSSSTKELLAITMLDDQVIGNGKPGPVHKRLHALYQDYKRDFRAGNTG